MQLTFNHVLSSCGGYYRPNTDGESILMILFTNKQQIPTEEDLQHTIGSFYDSYYQIIQAAAGYTRTWKYPGKKHGWLIKVEKGSRALFWLTPLSESYRIGFNLREKERLALLSSQLGGVLHQAVVDAIHYPEGYGFYVIVRDTELHNQVLLCIQLLIQLRS